MRLALRELRRRPNRFVVATAILTLIALLLMFLGGLLDGLEAGSTGALRQQPADEDPPNPAPHPPPAPKGLGPEPRQRRRARAGA